MTSQSEINSQLIKQKALELGFSACGISKVRPLEEEREHLQNWLSQGMNASMGYMANHEEKRLDPAQLVEGAKSIISLIINYFPSVLQDCESLPQIAKYAYGKDYHYVIKEKLNNLLIYIQTAIYPCKGRCFTDSAPVLERAWARNAGLGWTGKNTMLISPPYGSYVFISELIIDLELSYDDPFTRNYCGDCYRCIDACPTKAIVAPHLIDARKCISYHTIESKEEVPPEIVEKIGKQIFGCDICQDVCPWNSKLKPNQSADFKPIDGLLAMTGEDWKQTGSTLFKEKFKKSALMRAGYSKMLQNLSCLKV